MRINYDALMALGWQVIPLKDGVEICGTEPLPLAELSRFLDGSGLPDDERDQLMDDVAGLIEGRVILAAIRKTSR